MTTFEDLVNEGIRNGRSMFGLYPATDEQTLTDFAGGEKRRGDDVLNLSRLWALAGEGWGGGAAA